MGQIGEWYFILNGKVLYYLHDGCVHYYSDVPSPATTVTCCGRCGKSFSEYVPALRFMTDFPIFVYEVHNWHDNDYYHLEKL